MVNSCRDCSLKIGKLEEKVNRIITMLEQGEKERIKK